LVRAVTELAAQVTEAQAAAAAAATMARLSLQLHLRAILQNMAAVEQAALVTSTAALAVQVLSELLLAQINFLAAQLLIHAKQL
jgi:hypothetical protein